MKFKTKEARQHCRAPKHLLGRSNLNGRRIVRRARVPLPSHIHAIEIHSSAPNDLLPRRTGRTPLSDLRSPAIHLSRLTQIECELWPFRTLWLWQEIADNAWKGVAHGSSEDAPGIWPEIAGE